MKKLAQRADKVRDLSPSCQQRLNSYALAAAAAGVSVLALAPHSEAKIIYTHTHRVIGDGTSYQLGFTGQGTTDLTIQNKFYSNCNTQGTCFPSQVLAAAMEGRNQVVHNYFGAVAVSAGQLIGPKCGFSGGLEGMAKLIPVNSSSVLSGSWINVNNRYLGVRFKIKGQIHYGWARLNVRVQLPFAINATLTGYAYETVPNKPIIAGKTKGPDVNTVEPATLGRLALGRR